VLKSIEAALAKLSRKRLLCCVLVTVACVALRLAILPLDPKPEPTITDEFSYIFGAETLASGRLATPTHAMWRFFETYHINMQPAYVSKYPPGQAAFLALGIRIFGHPWYGVLMGVALMCGCICWMLQGWLAPKYALLGGLLAVLQFGAAHRWMDGYWGGAVAAIGGALVFGALPRIARSGTVSGACAAALGTAILANSRPVEGLAFVLLAFAALLWWTRGRRATWFRAGTVSAFAAIVLLNIGWMAYYNFRTTGSPMTFAYSVNQQRYAASPLFWFLPPDPPRVREYRDASTRTFWESYDVENYTGVHHNPLYELVRLYNALHELVGAGAGLTLLYLVVCAFPLVNVPRPRLVLVIIGLFFCAAMLDKYVYSHYLAPGLGALFVAAMLGLRFLRCYRSGIRRPGLALAASLVVMTCVLFVFDNSISIFNRAHRSDSGTAVGFRRRVAARLQIEPGRHLVLVRYAPGHNIHDEIIWNSPDIDAQKVVWAFDFGPNTDRPLLDYYRGRKVWRVEPDGANPILEPYSDLQAPAVQAR